MGELEKYLKKIAGKEKRLVDNGTGSVISMNPSVDFAGDNLIIITRTKESTTNNTAELPVISGNFNGVYPGAIVHADSNLVDGHPNILTGAELQRKPVAVGLDIFGNTQEPMVVNNPNQAKVMKAINQMVQNWCASGHTAATQMKYKTVSVYNEKQLYVELGIKGAGEKFEVDFKGTSEGKKREMLVIFDQIYYTARVEPQTASELYSDAVTVEDLSDNGVDEDNPLAALVTSMDFGRQIVVKLSTNNTTDKVEAAWKASICSTGFKNKNEYKDIMDNTNFSLFVLGGKPGTAAELISSKCTMEEINAIIAKDMDFTAESAAFPIGYSTNFIDDASKAIVTRTTEYVKTLVEKRKNIHITTDTANLYITKHQKFWGRPVIGIDANGNLQLGDWICLRDAGSGNQDFYIGSKYAEFGFEFDITAGTDWPYSDVFWTANQGAVKDIKIEWGGGCRTAWIDIIVDNNKVFHDGNCDSHNSKFGSRS